MADIDLKTSTPDTSLPTTGFLFGADSQAASAPSVFTTQAVATTLLGSTTLSGATITADAPVLNMSQTWNNGATTFTGLRFNATDTASNVSSLLMDLQVGGTSQFRVSKAGRTTLTDITLWSNETPGGTTTKAIWAGPNSTVILGRSGSAYVFCAGNGFGFPSANTLGWGYTNSGGTADLEIGRRAAANLRFGAADAAAPVAQTLSVQSVVAGTNNTAGANLTITGSQGTGTGAGGSIIFQVAPAGSSGTAQNALATTAQFGPFQGKLYLNSATPTASNYAIWGDGTNTWLNAPTSGGYVHFGSNDNWGVAVHPASVRISSTITLGWTASNPAAALDLILARDAANTLALRNGASAQTFRVYNTYTSATEFERGNIFWDSNVLKIGTEKGSAGGTARALEFQTDGTTRLTIPNNSANAVFVPGVTAAGFAATAGSSFDIINRLRLTAASDGVARISNAAATDFDRLQFGGTTSSFPALKRSSTTLQARLADDSAFASVQGKLTTDTAYAAGDPTTTGYLVVYDSTGTAYKIPAVAV